MSDSKILEKILENTEAQTKSLNDHIKYDFEKDQDMLIAIQETTQCIQKLDSKLDLHIQKMSYELNQINILDGQQNDMLNEHIRRTELAENRLNTLEEPRKFIRTAIKCLIGFGAITGAIYSIMRFLDA